MGLFFKIISCITLLKLIFFYHDNLWVLIRNTLHSVELDIKSGLPCLFLRSIKYIKVMSWLKSDSEVTWRP